MCPGIVFLRARASTIMNVSHHLPLSFLPLVQRWLWHADSSQLINKAAADSNVYTSRDARFRHVVSSHASPSIFHVMCASLLVHLVHLTWCPCGFVHIACPT